MSTTFQVSDTKSITLQPLVLNQQYNELARFNYSKYTNLFEEQNTTMSPIRRDLSTGMRLEKLNPLQIIPSVYTYVNQPPGTTWVGIRTSQLTSNWSEQGQGAIFAPKNSYYDLDHVYKLTFNPELINWGALQVLDSKTYFEKMNIPINSTQNKIALPGLKGMYEQTVTPDKLYNTVAFPNLGNITWKPEGSSVEYELNQLTQLYSGISYQYATTTTVSSVRTIAITMNTALTELWICACGQYNVVGQRRFIISGIQSTDKGIITLYNVQGIKILEWEINLSVLSMTSGRYFELHITYQGGPAQQTFYDKLISIFPQ